MTRLHANENTQLTGQIGVSPQVRGPVLGTFAKVGVAGSNPVVRSNVMSRGIVDGCLGTFVDTSPLLRLVGPGGIEGEVPEELSGFCVDPHVQPVH